MSSETALYVRVSTDDQNLARQKEETWNYAVKQLDVTSSEISVYEDKGTSQDTLRDDYQELMHRVRAGDVDRVIVFEVSRLSRSMRDLATTVETIVDEHNTGLHIIDMSLALKPGDDDPYQRAFLNIMGTIAQLEADMIRERTRSGNDRKVFHLRRGKTVLDWFGRSSEEVTIEADHPAVTVEPSTVVVPECI